MSDSNPNDASDARPADSILDTLARRGRRAPRVHLRDAGTGDGAPLIDPKAHALQSELSQVDQGKYRILGEIARGGMGIVLRGHDVELGREVAIKVVDANLAKRADVVERFVEEAQIGGQLQHPGIVPVYELGLMEDSRPYFTMKLIKGRTLQEMLTRRESLTGERVRFLRIFESVCQTMAYAHSKGVIHRDLKPANIMVGAFGEVQVVDWGLSKVLRRGGVADEVEARDSALTVIETVRSGPQSGSDSLVGNVLGTPAYMSPEQAQGEIDKLDERTDVFALGAILCEILTGSPAYVAPEGESLVQLAAMAELDGAKERIEASTASADLKRLCLTCLLPSRAARTRDAEKVASVVHAHLEGLETRAHEESLRAERSRRHLQLAVLVGALVLLVCGGWWWMDGQRRARQAELIASFDELHSEVLNHERDGNFERAIESARSGLRLVDSAEAGSELRARAEELLASTEERFTHESERVAEAVRESQLLDELDELRLRLAAFDEGDSESEPEVLSQGYRRVFGELGFELTDPDLGAALEPFANTPRGIRLAQGFDGWAVLVRSVQRMRSRNIQHEDEELAFEADLLTGIGLDLDPDPVRAEIRMALVEQQLDPLLALANSTDVGELAPETLFALAAALGELGVTLNDERGRKSLPLFALGADIYANDFALVSAASVEFAQRGAPDRALAYCRGAYALRPSFPGVMARLGVALSGTGDTLGAVEILERAIAQGAEYDWPLLNYSLELMRLGRLDAAIKVADEHLVWTTRMAAKYPGQSPSFLTLDLPHYFRARTGEEPLDDYLAWVAEQRWPALERWPRASLLLTTVPPPGLEPQPLRALELLEPLIESGANEPLLWMSLASAYALLGDGPSTIAAARKLERLTGYDRHNRAVGTLLAAAGYRLTGNAPEAEAALSRASQARDELYFGREEAWARCSLELVFERFGPIARGH